jgi:predicted amidohydrolase YtcJ
MHSIKFILTFFLFFTLLSCSENKLKTAFINGKIYTLNPQQPIAETVVVVDNKILFVGSNQEAEKFIDASTKVINLNGKLMLPGFNDSHLHFTSGGYYLLGINLRKAKSEEEFVSILKDYIKNREGRWVTGGRWDHESWKDKKVPTKKLIDDFTATTPVFVSRIDGHMGLANSKALELAGITKDTPNPDGGLIMKDPDTGEPTGILKDNAINLIFNVIPEKSLEDNIEAANRSFEEARKLGITSVQEMTQKGELEAYQKIKMNGNLTCRIYSIWPIDKYKDLVDENIKVNSGDEYIRRGGLKGYADGSLGAKTAWFFEPYENDTTFGLPMDIISNGKLNDWAIDADNSHLQLCVHAIGDKANNYMLNLYEAIEKDNSKWDRRFRIEHAQHLIPEDVKRFKEINVIASVQPYHAIDDGVWVRNRIGKAREMLTHMYKSYLDNNVVMAFGTDWPVAPLNPMYGIYAAVTRRTVDGKNPDGWIPEQKISIEEAIKAYTLNAAYASFEENIKGSIEVGKLADMVVLSENILTIDPVKIRDVKVEMTIFDGKVIYMLE